MAQCSLTQDDRCGYCYQQCDSMIDPRELPCHHVFCRPCIQEDHSSHGNVRCRTCQKDYYLETYDDLPEGKQKVKIEAERLDTNLSTCDVHECDGQVAVSYCIDCAKKMCDKHKQVHLTFFGESHKGVEIGSFLEAPKQYEKELCEAHNSELVEMCETCHKQICEKCDSLSGRCQYRDPQALPGTPGHKFRSMVTLKKEITTHYNGLLQAASNKLTEICKLDKQLWGMYDEEEVECKKRVEMVDRLLKEQINKITEESEKLKDQIHNYERKLTEAVESRNNGLMEIKEELEQCCMNVQKWLRDSGVTEQVQNKEETTQRLQTHTNTELPYQLSKFPHMMKGGRNLTLDVTLFSLPVQVKLKFTKSIPSNSFVTNSYNYSAAHSPGGDILLAGKEGVMSLVTNNQLVRATLVRSVCIHGNCLFFVQHGQAKSWDIYVYMFGHKCDIKLFSVSKRQDSSYSCLAASDRYIAVVVDEKETKVLNLFNFHAKSLSRKTLNVMPYKVHFLRDGDLLVISHAEPRSLTRYQVDALQLRSIWTCGDLTGACGLATDADETIYVCTSTKMMYLISPKGMKLQVIQVDALPLNPGEISIKDDEIVVPDRLGRSVSLFQICH